MAYGPVWDWKAPEIWGYISRNHLPVNPVYTKLRNLGAPERFLRVSAMLEELTTVLPRLREFVDSLALRQIGRAHV